MALFLFALLNEAIIEYLCGSVQILRVYLPLLSLATGILIAFFYQVSVFHLLLGWSVDNPFWEFLFSGFIIARLSNLINDLAQRYLGSK